LLPILRHVQVLHFSVPPLPFLTRFNFFTRKKKIWFHFFGQGTFFCVLLRSTFELLVAFLLVLSCFCSDAQAKTALGSRRYWEATARWRHRPTVSFDFSELPKTIEQKGEACRKSSISEKSFNVAGWPDWASFLLLGDCFSYNCRSSPNFGLLFPLFGLCIILTKNGLGCILGDCFSHLRQALLKRPFLIRSSSLDLSSDWSPILFFKPKLCRSATINVDQQPQQFLKK
jgi:hypothetical protein